MKADTLVLSSGDLWTLKSTPPAFKPATNLDLSGTWTDDDGNVATIQDVGGQLTYSPNSGVWWSRGKGTWVPKPPMGPVAYVGSQILTNGAQVQTLTFCVSSDLNTMIFGNGITWKRNQ